MACPIGDESYDNLFALLEKGGFFNPLFKDELLQQLDRIYSFSESTSDFRRNLEQEGLYMRLVTKKDKSYYVYGIKDSGFYLKDVSLPQKYRFGNIRFDGHGMSADEQKHYLYDHVFKALNASLGYEDFKKRLAEESIRVTEHVNSKGAYGISFIWKTWKMLMSLKVRIFPVSSLIRISRSISMVWLSVSRHISIG